MPTYTTSAKVLAHLPASPPVAVTGQTANDISDASDLVEARVGSGFSFAYESNAQKFPDITSTPATPAIIEQAARYLAVSMQFIRLKQSVSDGKNTQADKYEKKGLDILKGIANGEIAVELSQDNLKSSALDVVQDEIYETSDEPVFNTDDLNEHQY